MTALDQARDELLGLFHDLTESRLTRQRADRLEELLAADPANRGMYVDFMLVVGGLHRIGAARNDECGVMNDGLPTEAMRIGAPVSQSASVVHHFFSRGVLVSYMFAAVLLTAGAFAGFLAFGVGGREAARNVQSLPRPAPVSDAQQAPVVGYVTNVPGCRWADQGPAATLGSPVLLGRTFALASGALEITYNTGERITLRGPATFEARWFNGGFLSQGKLSAQAMTVQAGETEPLERRRLETYLKMAASTRAPGPAYSPYDPVGNFAIPMSSFFIRTPSALAMSRGAEFSMSVDGTGATDTRLALGVLEAWYPRGGKPNDVISSSARRAWSWVAFNPQHDVRVLYGTGTRPGALETALAGSAGRAWPAGASGGGELRIWGLESQQPAATAGTSPPRQNNRTNN